MACTNQHFVGNGSVYMRAIGDDCGAASESFQAVGDASELTISVSTDRGNHYESQSGIRRKTATWTNQTDSTFTLTVNDFNVANLVDLFLGTDSGAVAGTSVSDESVTVPGTGYVFVTYQGITSVTVTDDASPANTLTAGVDYNVNSRDGRIEILQMTNIPNNTILVSYTHVGVEGVVEALQNSSQDYEIKFSGINLNSPNKPVIVTLHRARVYPAEEFALIGQDITQLQFTGDLLLDSNNNVFEVKLANSVA